MLKTAAVLRHVAFEDLGSFAAVLAATGYAVEVYDIGVHDLRTMDPVTTDLVIVLGGPVGAYETGAYPVLARELDLLRTRLSADRPTFGICLGAQLIGAALGAEVRPSGTKEIGFSPLTLTPAGEAGALRHLAGVPVLHWHGDTFAIPEGAERLAETACCVNQAFARGRTVMGVQFHPEVDATAGFERWLIGHANELATAGLDPCDLRAEAERHGPHLREAGQAMFADWLGGLETP